MKNKLIKFIFAISIVFSSSGFNSEEYKINFIGLNFYPESTLLSLIDPIINSKVSGSKSNEIIESLYSTGYFADISVSESSNNLQITLKENPIIKYVEFENNTLNLSMLEILCNQLLFIVLNLAFSKPNFYNKYS